MKTINFHNSFSYSNILIEALKVYGEIKIDFVDALLFAYSKIGGHTIFTFDKKLNQLLEELNKA
jgi:predicted nucleic-acid-binding protein